jgi:transposase-like protein
MQNEHRAYEKAFKIEAVRLVQTSGKSISQVAKRSGDLAQQSVSLVPRSCRTRGAGIRRERASNGPGRGNPSLETGTRSGATGA